MYTRSKADALGLTDELVQFGYEVMEDELSPPVIKSAPLRCGSCLTEHTGSEQAL